MNFFPYKNRKKGVYYSRGTREADMARGAHVVEPHKATWTRGRVRGRVDTVGLALDGPMGIVGSCKIGGGH